jgi:protein-tyrosine phosphatase
MENKIRVLFVCLGNICRSPMGEGIFRHLVGQAGLDDRFHIDSAGTSGWHVGEKPDRRMRETALSHGISLENQRSRKFIRQDFQDFDYIIAMDRNNLRDIRSLRNGPTDKGPHIVLMRDFDLHSSDPDVPDPYYGGDQGFEEVYDLVYRSSEELLSHLKQEHGL